MTTPTPFALDLPLLVDHLNKLVRQLPKGEIGPSTGSLFGGLVQRLNSCGFEDVDLLCYVCTMERTNAKGEICKSGVGLSFGMAQGNQVVGRRGERTRDGLKVHAMTQAREEAGRGAMKLRSEVLTGGAAFAWVKPLSVAASAQVDALVENLSLNRDTPDTQPVAQPRARM